MEFLELAKHRCSIRAFSGKKVENEDLNYILNAGRVAPTACNKKPQRIIVVQETKNIEKVQKAYKTFGSSCIMIICRDEREALIREYDEANFLR
jgi:nitroreductase